QARIYRARSVAGIRPVRRTLTRLSNAHYTVEEKRETKMANRHVAAYTLVDRAPPQGAGMRILIADDHPIVRHGLKQMLASDPAATVVGEATNGDEALELARKVEWDMAIFDFSMPGRSGLDLLGDIKKEFPGKPVLILSMHSEDVHGSRVLRAGGAGYITKDSAPQELTTAVRKVA